MPARQPVSRVIPAASSRSQSFSTSDFVDKVGEFLLLVGWVLLWLLLIGPIMIVVGALRGISAALHPRAVLSILVEMAPVLLWAALVYAVILLTGKTVIESQQLDLAREVTTTLTKLTGHTGRLSSAPSPDQYRQMSDLATAMDRQPVLKHMMSTIRVRLEKLDPANAEHAAIIHFVDAWSRAVVCVAQLPAIEEFRPADLWHQSTAGTFLVQSRSNDYTLTALSERAAIIRVIERLLMSRFIVDSCQPSFARSSENRDALDGLFEFYCSLHGEISKTGGKNLDAVIGAAIATLRPLAESKGHSLKAYSTEHLACRLGYDDPKTDANHSFRNPTPFL